MSTGTVYLVGAGPGDPGLITVKAVDRIKRADVIVYDFLANEAVMDHARPEAERIYAGKMGGCHAMRQEDINRLLADKALEGKTVVRLKGGDPYIFGRGGEEASFLFEHGVPFEVIPGVSSSAAAPAYAGIPLTDRRHTASVTLITGHEDPTKDGSSINWDKIATGAGTVVFLMGVKNLPSIVENMIRHGRSADTPAAVIERGTTPRQKTVTGTLETIVARAREADIHPPSIILVGEVVTLRPQLNWFETRPLFGRTIVVTRARRQASGFLARLGELGAEAVAFPTIDTVPPDTFEPLDGAIRRLSDYQWLVFTSVNGVEFFESRLAAAGLDARGLSGIKVAAIGPATAERLRSFGITADFVPAEYRAEAVVDGMRDGMRPGIRVLLVRAARAREVLPEELRAMGAEVDVAPAYQTVLPTERLEHVQNLFRKSEVDAVTFTSSSTVSNFVSMFPGTDIAGLLGNTKIACIGPITADTAKRHGLTVHIQPENYTIDGLVDAIVADLGRKTMA